jgi:hypothetical protein
VKFERTHADALFGDSGSLVKSAPGERQVDFLQREQVFAHARNRVQAHRFGELAQQPGVALACGWRRHFVLVGLCADR